MLVIGARPQNTAQSGTQRAQAPAPQPEFSVECNSTDPVQAEVERALNSYQEALASEHVKGEVPGVEVIMRLDGEIVRVDIAEHVPIRYGADGTGELVVQAIREAAALAADRRAEASEQITFFGEPALERVQQLADDPEQSLKDMSAVRYW